MERIKNVKGVENYVIVDKEGTVIRKYPGMSVSRAEQFAAYFKKLGAQASHVVRDLNPEDKLTHFRLRANKHEILVSEGSDYMVVIQHHWTPAMN